MDAEVKVVRITTKNNGESYTAVVDCDGVWEVDGASPDEAVGHAIRSIWLTQGEHEKICLAVRYEHV